LPKPDKYTVPLLLFPATRNIITGIDKVFYAILYCAQYIDFLTTDAGREKMNVSIDNVLFKKMIIVFWTAWWLIALWTDVVGGLAHMHVLTASWAKDLNYPSLVQALSMYHVPSWLPACLFIGIVLWSLISTGLFFWTSVGLNRETKIWHRRAQYAFIISLAFWLAFFIADQLVMKFDLEQNHMVQGGFELLTYLMLYILPEQLDRG
jgi:hypothetical protein